MNTQLIALFLATVYVFRDNEKSIEKLESALSEMFSWGLRYMGYADVGDGPVRATADNRCAKCAMGVTPQHREDAWPYAERVITLKKVFGIDDDVLAQSENEDIQDMTDNLVQDYIARTCCSFDDRVVVFVMSRVMMAQLRYDAQKQSQERNKK